MIRRSRSLLLRIAVALPVAAMAASAIAAEARLAPPRPPDAEELSVSAGSWLCGRYLPAAGGNSASARAITDAVEPFALGYVAGVADATGRQVPETAEAQRRVLTLLVEGCSADAGRSIRDVTLLAGRAMTDTATVLDASAPVRPGPGSVACREWLQARAGSPAPREDNWAEGYVNARFERAGRGLIPTARNRARVLEQVAGACAASPAAPVREAARHAAEQALASAGAAR